MSRHLVGLIAALGAGSGCTSDSEESPPGDTGEFLDTGIPVSSAPEREPTLSDAEIQEALDEAFVHILSMDPRDALDGFETLLSEVSESGCPTLTEYSNRTDIKGNCTTDDGVTLVIDVRWHREEASTSGGSTTFENALMTGDALVYDETTVHWDMADWVELEERTTTAGYRVSTARLLGVLAADSPEWLGEGLSTALDQVWYTDTDSLTPAVYVLQGGASGIEGTHLVAYSVHELGLQTTVSGGPCDIEPHGSIWFRTVDGDS